MEQASGVWMRFTGRPNTSAVMRQTVSLRDPPPDTNSSFISSPERFSMMRRA
jgi:hypothetical protein